MKAFAITKKIMAALLVLFIFIPFCGCTPSLEKAIAKADAMVENWGDSFYSYYGSYEEYSDADAYMLVITCQPCPNEDATQEVKDNWHSTALFGLINEPIKKTEELQKCFKKFDNVQIIVMTVDEDGSLLDAYVDGEWTAVG